MLLETFCQTSAGIWKFIGQILLIFKIIIPVVLVIIGVVTLGKAVIGDDDKAIKKATTDLIKKVIVGVIIFFIPTIIAAVFNLIDGFSGTGFDTCIKCVSHPNSKCNVTKDNDMASDS